MRRMLAAAAAAVPLGLAAAYPASLVHAEPVAVAMWLLLAAYATDRGARRILPAAGTGVMGTGTVAAAGFWMVPLTDGAGAVSVALGLSVAVVTWSLDRVWRGSAGEGERA